MVCHRWRSGRLAQLVERLLYTERVGGSSPSPPTSNFFAFDFIGKSRQVRGWYFLLRARTCRVFCARFKDRVLVDGGMAQAAFREGRVLCPLQIAEMSLAVLGENVLGGHGACRSAGTEKPHSEDNVRHRLCFSLGSRA